MKRGVNHENQVRRLLWMFGVEVVMRTFFNVCILIVNSNLSNENIGLVLKFLQK